MHSEHNKRAKAATDSRNTRARGAPDRPPEHRQFSPEFGKRKQSSIHEFDKHPIFG